ncbi:MAG: molecular chaperone DnaJ [Sandaracinus sp.]
MGQKRDYYEVLGIERTVTTVEIKKAYKKLARELHPDVNPNDPTAEERFKEASEAYAVLSDEQKRALYDRHGHAGLEQRGGGVGFGGIEDIFSSFGDIFGDIFGDFGRRANGPQRGSDVRAGVRLTLEEAAFGTTKEVKLAFPAPCTACNGSGAEGGKLSTCPTCAGHGQVVQGRGGFMLRITCPACRGAGQIPGKPCATCNGRAEVPIERTVKVNIPAGIDEGRSLRLSGQGQPGRMGGPAGHLYVVIEVLPHERFQRDGDDLVHELHVSFTQAALGAKIPVELLGGEKVDVTVPAGTQPGEAIRVRDKGIASLEGRGRGNLVCVVQIDVPKKLTAKAKKLLLELQEALEKDG